MTTWQNWLVVIPARLRSSRLAHKPLVDLAGKPLIIRVVDNIAALRAKGAEIIVATDSHEVLAVCQEHGYQARMTRDDHPSGTDRIAEIAQDSPKPYVLNVQGDDPFIHLQDLEALRAAFDTRPDLGMGTLVYRSQNLNDFMKPQVVKAVRGADGYALYFSRAPIPHTRDPLPSNPLSFWHHQGVYAYKRETLLAFTKMLPSPLEQQEALEQLRALENHIPIYLVPAKHYSFGIDTAEDLEAAHAHF